MTIKAIETTYNGYKFRSRLEARWALFFDELGIEYQYEMEGFELAGGVWYLPDFWLPYLNVWVEVKPPNHEESIGMENGLKILALARQSGHPVVVTNGDPGSYPYCIGAPNSKDTAIFCSFAPRIDGNVSLFTISDDFEFFDITLQKTLDSFDGYDLTLISKAWQTARQARF